MRIRNLFSLAGKSPAKKDASNNMNSKREADIATILYLLAWEW